MFSTKTPSEITFSDFQYLSQPELSIKAISHSESYILQKHDKKPSRKIFEGVPLEEFELQRINELKKEIELEGLITPENWEDPDFLRICYGGYFKLPACIKLLKKHLDWLKNERFHCLDEPALEYLRSGVIYLNGTDKWLRPVLVFDVYKIDMKTVKIEILLSAFCFLLTAVKKNMFHGGKVENWVILIDINNMSLFNVPLKLLGQVIDCMSNNYLYSLEQLYILKPSTSLSFIWKMIEAMMDEVTTRKIKFLKNDNFNQMNDYIETNQLQEKYGGTASNLIEFWPPKYLKENDNSDMIEKVNENLYGDYLVEQETNGKMSNLSISGKNESKFLSFNNESNNLINFERSSNNFKRSTFRKEKEEVFYSVLSNEEGKNENKRHFSDISLKSKSRKKSVSDLEVNTESCGCMCNLI